MEKLRQTLRVKKERAILVAAVLRVPDGPDGLVELTALAESAGAVVVDRFQQKIRKINPATYIGKGKVASLPAESSDSRPTLLYLITTCPPVRFASLRRLSKSKSSTAAS